MSAQSTRAPAEVSFNQKRSYGTADRALDLFVVFIGSGVAAFVIVLLCFVLFCIVLCSVPVPVCFTCVLWRLSSWHLAVDPTRS